MGNIYYLGIMHKSATLSIGWHVSSSDIFQALYYCLQTNQIPVRNNTFYQYVYFKRNLTFLNPKTLKFVILIMPLNYQNNRHI